MNMKDMIQRMTDLESSAKQQLTEDVNEGCGDMPMNPPMDQGNPVSMNVSLSASGKDHVSDLIDMMKNAGMNAAAPVSQDMMPMRTDIERLRGIVDGPEKDGKLDLDMDGDHQPDLDTESSIKESQSVDKNAVLKLLKDFDETAQEFYRAYGDVNIETVMSHLEQGDAEAARDEVGFAYAGDDGEEPGRGFDDALEDLENEFKHMVGMGENVQEGVPGSIDAETVEAILKLKEVMMDKGMEPEEAQDEAAETFGVNPEDLADYLDSQYDEGYDNEPEPEYRDQQFMTKDISGGLNKEKKAYPAAQDGDNAMAAKIKEQLMSALSEKKAKPDYIDIDGDGDEEEPMKKAAKDAKKKDSEVEEGKKKGKKSPAGGPGCWDGKKIHPTKPTKMKGGKRVNNCIDADGSDGK